MYNRKLIASLLEKEAPYPAAEAETGSGLRLRLENGCLLLEGTASDLIDLADLLVSLALSGENRGQHWHLDDLTLIDRASEISELILSRK